MFPFTVLKFNLPTVRSFRQSVTVLIMFGLMMLIYKILNLFCPLAYVFSFQH